MRRVVVSVVLLLLSACSDGTEPPGGSSGTGGVAGSGGLGGTGGAPLPQDGGPGPDDNDAGAIADDDAGAIADDAGLSNAALYSTTEPLAVRVTLGASAWDTLRAEGRSMPRIMAGCTDPNFTDYSEHPAEVEVLGHTLTDADVRKKGFLGSISVYRPSLRIDVGRGASARFYGQKHLTLNNNRQDKSNARQCVTYALFEQAGLRVPRCGLATLYVNGVDLGHYTIVEPIAKPFLARVFDANDGNLYESTVPADLTAQGVDHLELKTNEDVADRSDLNRIVSALAAPDAELLTRLAEVFDLDELFSYWTMEVLVGHWDALARNLNNTFLYHDPSDDRFHPIPWGTDQSFSQAQPGEPRSVFARNALFARLYAHAEARSRYRARLLELLDSVWDEDAIVQQLEAIASVTGAPDNALDKVTQFVRSQRSAIETELAANGGAGTDPVSVTHFALSCTPPPPASSAIDFTWDVTHTAYKLTLGLTMDIPYADGKLSFVPLSTAQLAAIQPDGNVQMGIAGMEANTGEGLFVGLIMPIESYRAGRVDFHGFETFGVIASDTDELRGYIGGGSITFDQVGMTVNAPVKGSWQGQIFTP